LGRKAGEVRTKKEQQSVEAPENVDVDDAIYIPIPIPKQSRTWKKRRKPWNLERVAFICDFEIPYSSMFMRDNGGLILQLP
jgi:hypothetical protein